MNAACDLVSRYRPGKMFNYKLQNQIVVTIADMHIPSFVYPITSSFHNSQSYHPQTTYCILYLKAYIIHVIILPRRALQKLL